MSTSPDRRFEAFAAREPYFAVLSDPRFRRANLTAEAEREFFASGETLVSWMLNVVDAALAPQFAPMSILEYGCGIGRLALPLAQRPGTVVAVDRSAAMLEAARREAERHALAHIVFQSADEFWAAPRVFDLVVCYHVLQRLPREAAMDLARRLLDRVGPGGVGIFQWPYRSSQSPAVGASRWIREHVPGANPLANLLLEKPAGDPFIPTHTFDVAEMLPLFDGAACRASHVALEHQEGLDYAVAFVQKGNRASARPVTHPRAVPAPEPGADAIDSEISAFNRAAEAYFASLTDWDHHLAKPFSQLQETPAILMSVAVLLQALDLAPGMTVLEFGAGSGWLSRWLTQLGCRVYLLDVSSTALRIARDLYQRHPVVGARLPPEFLEFDGRRIPLEDAAVDRVVCFDAFHHAANPRAVIREFARVLAGGGIAGFVEPGPRHADAPRSRFEADTYGVVERDVDVHDIWRTASACGFGSLDMCVFHGPPYLATLDEYEDLLAGGPAQERWSASTRKFLRHVRTFRLTKQGTARRTSLGVEGLACEIRAELTGQTAAGEPILIDAVVTNSGTATWLPSGRTPGGVSLGAHLYDASGALLKFDFHVEPLTEPPREVAPGETVRCRLTLPPLEAGRYRIELDCVADRVTWFAQAGSRPVTLPYNAG